MEEEGGTEREEGLGRGRERERKRERKGKVERKGETSEGGEEEKDIKRNRASRVSRFVLYIDEVIIINSCDTLAPQSFSVISFFILLYKVGYLLPLNVMLESHFFFPNAL